MYKRIKYFLEYISCKALQRIIYKYILHYVINSFWEIIENKQLVLFLLFNFYFHIFAAAPKINVPPRFREISTFEKGESVVIKIPFTGNPKPTVKWIRDGEELRGSHYLIEVTDRHALLTIKEANKDDDGPYRLHLENDLGIDSVIIKIQVNGKLNIPITISMNLFFFYPLVFSNWSFTSILDFYIVLWIIFEHDSWKRKENQTDLIKIKCLNYLCITRTPNFWQRNSVIKKVIWGRVKKKIEHDSREEFVMRWWIHYVYKSQKFTLRYLARRHGAVDKVFGWKVVMSEAIRKLQVQSHVKNLL